MAADARKLFDALPKAYGAELRFSPRMKVILDLASDEAQRLQDEYISTEHLFVALASEPGRSPAAQLLQRNGVTKDALYKALTAGPRQPARDVAEPGSHLRGARPLRPRPDGAGAQRQARSGHRPRRGSPPRHPGAVAPHQEQPGAHRRARRRQDRHRRRSCAADRPRRRAGRAEEQEDLRASTWARSSPARSIAASSRSGSRPSSRRSPSRTARSSCSSTSCTRSSAPAPPKARWTRRRC